MSEDRALPDLAADEFQESISEAELTGRVWRALLSVMADLSPMERAVLALRNGFAFTPAEVARILHIEESEVDALTEGLRQRMSTMRPEVEAEDDAVPSSPDPRN